MAFTINGKSGTDYLAAAKARQAKGQFDETGAREAIARIQGRQMPEYDKTGQRVIGGSGGSYNYQPPARKPEAAKPAPKPEPARQTAAMPKPASHASQAKAAEPKKDLDTLISSTQEQITKARATKKPVRPTPKVDERGSEHGHNFKIWEAKQRAKANMPDRRARAESSLHKAQNEARKVTSYKEPTKYTPKASIADSQMGEFTKTVKETGRGIAKALNANDPDSWINDPLGIRRRRQLAAK